jgi:hypothetical protein
MDCSICRHLTDVYHSAHEKYLAARNGVFHAVSTELAASRFVDMERAKNDLLEHQAVCRPVSSGKAMAA